MTIALHAVAHTGPPAQITVFQAVLAVTLHGHACRLPWWR